MTETEMESMNHTAFANNFNSTLSSSFDDNFYKIITNPFFYGSSIIFLLLFVISIIIFIKNKPKLLLAKPA